MGSTHLLLLLSLASYIGAEPLVVQTSGGLIRGFTSRSRGGRTFLAFTGIPFAKPPVGNLRFQPPQEPEPWHGIKNSTEPLPKCLQFDSFLIDAKIVGDEDCLYLSVFTHSTKGSRPVIVNIHGGGFMSGSSLNVGPMKFMMDEDVVIVDTQYRLGILGFLSFQDPDLPGNMGLKDQTMALRWVKNNIANFGGDPDRVTILGASAGGASVYFHTISPLSKGLFHRAIAESGSSYNPWALVPSELALDYAKRTARDFSCPITPVKDAVECLRKVKGEDFVKELLSFRVWQVNPMLTMQPVMEPPVPQAFLSGPKSSWKHSHVPLLTGFTSGEGLMMTKFYLYSKTDFDWLNDNFNFVAPITMLYNFTTKHPDSITEQIREFYFKDRPISMNEWVNLTNAYTDGLMATGIMEGADKHKGNVYFYYFDYLSDSSTDNRTIDFAPSHTFETFYMWYADAMKGKDLALSYDLIKIWTGFAKTGVARVPNCKAIWKKWQPNRHDFMHISNSGFKGEEGLLEERIKFWKNLKM